MHSSLSETISFSFLHPVRNIKKKQYADNFLHSISIISGIYVLNHPRPAVIKPIANIAITNNTAQPKPVISILYFLKENFL